MSECYTTQIMPNPFLGVRIPPEVHEALMAEVKATGQSKSDLVIEALKAYLGMASQHNRIEELEMRLSALEVQLEHLSQQSDPLKHHRETLPMNHSMEESYHNK